MYKFIFISIRKNIIPIIFLLFTIGLVVFSKNNLLASKEGLLLWANNIVPSLLPFFIATELLNNTDIVYKFGKSLEPIMKPIFNVPGIGIFPLIMGIISGYPTGAKIISNLKDKGFLTDIESERLISFTNNSGPLFILGTVGVYLFGNTTIGILLLVTHILSSLTVGFIFRFWKNNIDKNNMYYKASNNKKHLLKKQDNKSENVTISNLGNILSSSIFSSIKTVLMIGGFVVLFSVILSILKETHILNFTSSLLFPFFKFLGLNKIEFPIGFISGILEVTNGLNIITNIPFKKISCNVIITSFLLGFGGISVLLQVYSIISKSNISIKPYIIGKLLHGIIASVYTSILIYTIPFFNFDL